MKVAPIPVLLVDDKTANLLAFEAILESGPYELVRAHSGEEAIRAVEVRDFAVVLLDVQMPTMDGFHTATRLRRVIDRTRPPVPIIFVTASDGDPSRILRAYAESGAVDFIQKPLDAAAIRAKVAVFAELYRARHAAIQGLRALSDLAIALAKTTRVEEVASVIVEEGMRAARADTCSLYLIDETQAELQLVGHRGVAPEIVEQTRRIAEASSPRTFALLRAGTSSWTETAADYERQYPALANMEATGGRARAFWSVPLVAEARLVGLLGMGFYEEQHFDAQDRVLVDTLTKQCAQALLRAVRLTLEERARVQMTTTLRSIGDGVIATDAMGRVTLMNAVAEKLTGWAENAARGRPLDEIFPIYSEVTRERCESPVTKVLREGTIVGLANHTVLRSRSGTEIPIDDSAAPIRDGTGTLFGVVLVFRDATDEKREFARRAFLARAGAELASSLDYRTTLSTVAQLTVPELADWCGVDLLEPGERALQQVAVAHVDPEKVKLARALARRYPPAPDADTGVPKVVRSGKSELYPELPPSIVASAARDPEHLRILHELKLESAMIVPLRGRERTLGAMTFIYAESGRRYTEQDLAFAEEFARRAGMAIENAHAFKEAEVARSEERRLRRDADVANKAKDEFLAVVSHELRTPLNAILGWATILRTKQLGPDLDRAMGVIERNAQRQARLIDDVLDISRIISGKLTLNLGRTNIADAVASAIDSVTPAAEAKQITLEVEAAPALAITADADRLQQIIWNLLANAVKFTPNGGHVSIRSYLQGSEVCIRVVDTGEGIAEDVLPHVFEPFRQADAATTRRHGGLGLGLAIVKQLVTAHGGTIRAESDGPGRGSRFIVALPAHDAVPIILEKRAPKAMGMDTAVTAAPRLEGLSILIVDDEADTRDVVGQFLRTYGATVTSASSGEEALDMLPNLKPDVIVSDIGMPDMDGYALMRRVRSLPVTQGARTPALALTAYARREDAQRAFAAGFQMHVSKPVEPVELVTIVANLAGLPGAA